MSENSKKMRKKAIVLAAGKGTRMKSELPKVICPVLGRPMIDYVLDALDSAGVDEVVVVVGFRGDLVREAIANRANVRFVEQTGQLGTGHAVMSAQSELEGFDGPVFVIAGDSPLLRAESIEALFEEYERRSASGNLAAAILGTVVKESPFGMGRILRDAQGMFLGIVEEKDATEEQRKITEINMSYYVFHAPDLLDALGALRTDNAQGEYYLTDVPAILRTRGQSVLALPVLQKCEALGVNRVEDLIPVEAALRELG